MKRFALFVALLLLLTACSAAEVLTEPPAATVICGDQQIHAVSGGYDWQYKKAGDTIDVTATGIHPLDTTREAVVTDQSTATLRFGVQPQRISVRCWSEKQRGNIQAQPSDPLLNGNELSLRSGSYIYAISATWKTERYSGNCSYVVVIRSTAEEPTLTKPPAMTVTCGDKTANAKLGAYNWTHSADGKTTAANADGNHPLMLLSPEDRLDFSEGKVQISFEAPPDRMESRCWYDSDLGKTVDGNSIDDYWAGYSMDSANGGFIVEVHAYWDDRNGYEGDARYCFYINKQPQN